jgi:hypothetical protein
MPEEKAMFLALSQAYFPEDHAASAAPNHASAGYAAISGKARRIAAAQRRRLALREIWISLGAWRMLIGASAMTVVVVVGLAVWKGWPTAPLAMSTLDTNKMETLEGFPNLPELWLRRAKPGYANATSPLVVKSRVLLKSVGNELLRATLEGGATLELRGTVEVDQSDANRVHVTLLDGVGEVQVSVPHLRPGSSLVVSGAHADAIVHGTRFRVEDLGNGGTAVQVFEGLVEVAPHGGNRPSAFLAAGSSLRVPSLDSYLRDINERINTAVQTGDCQSVESIVSAAIAAAKETDDPSAALYLSAVCAARTGATDSAIRDFEWSARVSKDPTRSDNALARAAELRQSTNPASAMAAWRSYLARFPHGLHRGMAARFLSDQPRTAR